MPEHEFAPLTTRNVRPIHAMLLPVGAALLLGALVTDLIYLKTVAVEWETFSVWLITGGLIVAGLTALALIFDLVAYRRSLRVSWMLFLCAAVAIGLSIVNAFVHSRDGYTAVAPSGVILSVIVALLLVVLGVNGWSLCRRLQIVQVA